MYTKIIERKPSGTAYLAPQWGSDSPPILAAKYKEGRLISARSLGRPQIAVEYVAAPTGSLIYYATEDSDFYFDRATKAIRKIPKRDYGYTSFAPDSGLVLFPFNAHNGNEYGYGVSRVGSWEEVWRQVGAASPLWDVTGKRLVFARYVDGGNYWPHMKFPARFYKENSAYRHRQTHWFVADFSRVGKPGIRRISEIEASHLVGKWSNLYIKLHLDEMHDSLCQPRADQILQSPNGRGVVVQVSDPLTKDNAETFAHPPNLPGDLRGQLIYIDSNGSSRRYLSSYVLAVCWAADRLHVYGNMAGHELDDTRKMSFFYRFNTHNGELYKMPMPKTARTLITFIED